MQSFKIIQPSPILRSYIRHYWILESDMINATTERTFPLGCIQIFFHKKKQLFSQTYHKMQPQNFICGQENGYTDICANGDIEMLVVVFQPYAAKIFFRQPLSLFQGENIAIEDVEDRELTELTHKIADTENNIHCINLIEQFLLHRLVVCSDYNIDRLSTVIQNINLNPYLDVCKLANTACLSTKQFTRVFTEYIGTSLKKFLRIIRVQRSLFLLQQNPQYNFAQVAYSCGFSDQSHMIRDFKLFTGYTPLEYLSVYTPISDYFSDL